MGSAMPSPLEHLGTIENQRAFGKNMFRFWEKHAPLLVKNCLGLGRDWLGFWIGLGQSSSLTVLNAEHVWVWIFEVLGVGVIKNKSTGGKLER